VIVNGDLPLDVPVAVAEVSCSRCKGPLPADVIANVVTVSGAIAKDPIGWQVFSDLASRLNPPKPKSD
jgi:hypothetical protein